MDTCGRARSYTTLVREIYFEMLAEGKVAAKNATAVLAGVWQPMYFHVLFNFHLGDNQGFLCKLPELLGIGKRLDKAEITKRLPSVAITKELRKEMRQCSKVNLVTCM